VGECASVQRVAGLADFVPQAGEQGSRGSAFTLLLQLDATPDPLHDLVWDLVWLGHVVPSAIWVRQS